MNKKRERMREGESGQSGMRAGERDGICEFLKRENVGYKYFFLSFDGIFLGYKK